MDVQPLISIVATVIRKRHFLFCIRKQVIAATALPIGYSKLARFFPGPGKSEQSFQKSGQRVSKFEFENPGETQKISKIV